MIIGRRGVKMSILKRFQELQREKKNFLEASHRSYKGTASLYLSKLPKYHNHQQIKNVADQKSDISTTDKSNYEQKTCSLKPGQKLNSRPNLDIKQMLKQTKRLSY